VRYWCIGNESYLPNELGAKTIDEWGPFVREAAKMMRRVDPSIEVVASCIGRDKMYQASATDYDWNSRLLKEAGDHIDWVAIHGYWDRLNRIHPDRISPYDSCIFFSNRIEERILLVKHLLGALDMLGRVKIAFDEWNLRCWHHPDRNAAGEEVYLLPRDLNDLNSQYTTADAIFAACFLNQCLKHCDVVGMANFSPVVNARGMIFAHPEGIVKRSTYHVFSLFAGLMGDTVVDWWIPEMPTLDVVHEGAKHGVPALDTAATLDSKSGTLAVSLVNRDPERPMAVAIEINGEPKGRRQSRGDTAPVFRFLSASDKDSYNDIECPEAIRLDDGPIISNTQGRVEVEIPPHSVGVVRF
jgi:alpha-N-arabinofuranosidase